MSLTLGYIGLSLLMTVIIILMGFRAINRTFTDPAKVRNKKLLLVGGLALWHLYSYLMGISGFLTNFELPPRFPIFMILPAFLFTGIFIYRNRKAAWLDHIPKSWLIYYQSFRILVESLFVASVAQGILHYQVTIEGYNFDMVFGFTAPVVAYLVFQARILPEKAALYWNYLGLAVLASIIFVFFTTIFYPEMYAPGSIQFKPELGMYPFVLVPSFLMPSAVFMHVLSIVQLSRKST